MAEVAGLYYEEHGPPHAPPIVLSPGLGGSRTYWAHNIDALAAAHRVIAYDHRGTGDSDRVLQNELTVEHMADDLLRLIDGIGLVDVTVIGHAAGGAIGLSLALRAPRLIDRLVVINGWSSPDPHFIRCFETRLALLESGVEEFLHAQPIFLYPARWSSAHNERLRVEEKTQLEHFQGEENIRARIAALCAFDIEASLDRLGLPILLVAAEDDMLVPASCSEGLALRLPNAKLARMTGGHACNVADPDRFNKILLGWLAGERLKGAA